MKPVAEDFAGPELSNEHVAAVLSQIKRNARDRRIALMAPLALVGAVLGTLIAAPPQYGGLTLPDADAAVTELPRVFGANGVWREAEPIEESPVGVPGPASVVRAATESRAPSYVLVPPDRAERLLPSLPVSTSPPPTSTPGQSFGSAAAGLDWSAFQPANVGPVDTAEPSDVPTPSSSPSGEDPTTTNDITVAVPPQDELDSSTATPSTPASPPVDFDVAPPSARATIIQKSVLVYSAHVSVTVVVVDDDSSVIDWCKTRVDWGDGSVTRAADTYGVAPCTAPCEYGVTPSGVGINEELVFTHNYTRAIDAAPRIVVATGDGCNSDVTEFQLDPFRVIPY